MLPFSRLYSWLTLQSKPTCCCRHTKTACHGVEIFIRLKPSALVLFIFRSVADRKAAAFLQVSDDRSADFAIMTAQLPVCLTDAQSDTILLQERIHMKAAWLFLCLLWPTNDWNLVCHWGSMLKIRNKVRIGKTQVYMKTFMAFLHPG